MSGLKAMVDLDGVIVDYIGGLHKSLGIEYNPNKYPYPVSKFDIFEDIIVQSKGMRKTEDIFIHCATHEFWEELEWTPNGRQILKTIEDIVGVHNITICTAPMPGPYAWSGKISWLNKNIPQIKDIIISTAPKCLLAKPGHVLIDDRNSNVDQFREAGGKAFLIPGPWNRENSLRDTDYIPMLKRFLIRQVSDFTDKAH